MLECCFCLSCFLHESGPKRLYRSSGAGEAGISVVPPSKTVVAGVKQLAKCASGSKEKIQKCLLELLVVHQARYTCAALFQLQAARSVLCPKLAASLREGAGCTTCCLEP